MYFENLRSNLMSVGLLGTVLLLPLPPCRGLLSAIVSVARGWLIPSQGISHVIYCMGIFICHILRLRVTSLGDFRRMFFRPFGRVPVDEFKNKQRTVMSG